MKRHEAIAKLSQDHHQALRQAMLLKRATDETAAGVANAFVEFFDDEAQKHFEVEEQVLLPLWATWVGLEELVVPMIVQMVREHVELRTLVELLRRGQTDTAFVREVGQRLDSHVRLEERKVFPRIQQSLTDEQLAELAVAVLAAESA